MDALRDTLQKIAARIKRHKGTRRINGQNTKATQIKPVLRALGWAVEDLDEVQRKLKIKRRDKPVDYALLDRLGPRVFIARRSPKPIDHPRDQSVDGRSGSCFQSIRTEPRFLTRRNPKPA